MSDTNPDRTLDFGGLSAAPVSWPARRPVRIALLGDFGGGALSGRLDTGAALSRRKPLKVEFDSLDDAIGRLDLRLRLPLGADGAPVEVPITELESFHPDELYRHLDLFSQLSSLRKRLNNTATFAAAAKEVAAFADPTRIKASTLSARTRSRGDTLAAGGTLDDFARLTGRPSVHAQADAAISTLMRNIVGPFVVPAADPKREALVAAVDEALSDALRAVLHQPDFQNTESLWRGVDFLLRRLETSHQLQVHLFDVSAEEFAADLSAVDDLSETGLYKLLVETPSQDADGGYTYLAGLYHFEATPPQAELLGRAARVAAHAGAPLLTAIATDAFTDRREPPHRLVREAFEALKTMSDASWLALLGPRFLLRHPYGKKTDPISSFAFEEFSRNAGLRGMLWGHPALLALCVLGVHGGQLTIDDLPFHFYVDQDGDKVALPCTERLIHTQAAALLRDYGINGLMAHKGEPLVRLSGLKAINDDGLAAAGTTGRKAASDSRCAIQSRIKTDDKAPQGWTPQQRRGGAVSVSLTTQAAPADEAPAVEAGASADAELDALLAGLETAPAAATPAGAGGEAPAAGGSGDPELDALLASLEASDAPAAGTEAATAAATAGAAAADDDGMDPELAALLKSLG